jgi:cell division protein FtsL
MSARAVRSPVARPVAGGWGVADQQVARFHRERDRRRLVAMIRTLAGAALLVVLVLGVVGLRIQQVRVSYRMDGLRAMKAQMEEQQSRLRVELDMLRSHARIESRARAELQMGPPAPNQIQLAREYVPGGDGVSMAVPLTAAADKPVPSTPGVR